MESLVNVLHNEIKDSVKAKVTRTLGNMEKEKNAHGERR